MPTLAQQLASALAKQRKRDTRRLCAKCGEPFVGYNTQRYCSSRCQNAATSAAYRQRKRT